MFAQVESGYCGFEVKISLGSSGINIISRDTTPGERIDKTKFTILSQPFESVKVIDGTEVDCE